MIYTITLNPALDYILEYKKPLGKHQKTTKTKIIPGGKGINASILFDHLAIANKAIIASGGFTGIKLKELLQKQKLNFINLETKVDTRINVKTNAQNQTWEMNAQGQEVDGKLINQQLLEIITQKIKPNDIVMIMGSLPLGYDFEQLETLLQAIIQKQGQLIFDFDQAKLFNLSKYGPEIIKPNLKELAQIFKVKIITTQDVFKYAQKLHNQGAKRVLVSLDKAGAIYYDQQNQFIIEGIKIKEVNGSGAGDSMLAAFAAGLIKEQSIVEILKLATAAGTATAATQGIATKSEIQNYLNQIKIKKWEK